MSLHIRRLSSGHFHVRGNGPCNWSQPPVWPCSYETLKEHAHPEASEEFLRFAVATSGVLQPRFSKPEDDNMRGAS